MKKIIVFLFCIMLLVLSFSSKEENYIIPKESIRFRIIASSNSDKDQQLKWQVNQKLIPILSDITKNSSSIENTKLSIKNNLDKIETVMDSFDTSYQINFGNNYFPLKIYKKVEYEEGYYESLVITLDEGLGDNWWCVLFPPLCLLEAQSSEIDDVTYTTYLKEIINKYF